MLGGRARWMGLGPLHIIGLADARARAAERRLQRYDGIDPIEARRAERQRARLDAARSITFESCAERYIAGHNAGWRNPKQAGQWGAVGSQLKVHDRGVAIGTGRVGCEGVDGIRDI
jgi:hypothetical protein